MPAFNNLRSATVHLSSLAAIQWRAVIIFATVTIVMQLLNGKDFSAAAPQISRKNSSWLDFSNCVWWYKQFIQESLILPNSYLRYVFNFCFNVVLSHSRAQYSRLFRTVCTWNEHSTLATFLVHLCRTWRWPVGNLGQNLGQIFVMIGTH